jgi:hypothetical protein
VGTPALDPEAILESIRAERQALVWEPLPPGMVRRGSEGDQIRNRRSLEYLHRNWALPDSFDAADAGGGVRGRIITLFGRLTFRVLGRYLSRERDLLAHLVQVNEALEQRCDELTLRCQQLNQDMIDRQVAEACNQAKLAVWLHLDTPTTAADAGRNGRVDAGDASSTP